MFRVVCSSLVTISVCGAGWASAAQTPGGTRHWVFLEDKGFTGAGAERAAIDSLASTYDERSVRRRMLRRSAPGLFDSRDLPLCEGYVREIEALGAEVHVASRWLNAVSVEAGPEELAAVARLPFVERVEPVRGGRRLDPGGSAPVGAGGASRSFYGYSEEQLAQIGLTGLHSQGYTGDGVLVGILDTGFYRDHEAFNDNSNPLPVVAEWDFIDNDGNTSIEAGDYPDQHMHGTLILGAIRAYKPDTLVGGAYDASVILCKTEDVTSETPIEEDNYIAGLEFIEANGGDMATSSLGYIDWYTQEDLDGQTAVTTIGVNIATANGVHCCTAAGNSGNDSDPGTSHLIAPADAFQVITCGAVYNEGNVVGFSSDGPTADGRVKPEVLARGVDTYTVWPYDTFNYTTASGTSLSTPLVASAVACLIQARPWWQPEAMRQHLFATAGDFVQYGQPDPLFVRGYGVLNASAALADDCPADFNGDGSSNTQDVLAFLNAWAAHDARGDFNGDGSTNTQDVIAFLNAWVSGC